MEPSVSRVAALHHDNQVQELMSLVRAQAEQREAGLLKLVESMREELCDVEQELETTGSSLREATQQRDEYRWKYEGVSQELKLCTTMLLEEQERNATLTASLHAAVAKHKEEDNNMQQRLERLQAQYDALTYECSDLSARHLNEVSQMSRSHQLELSNQVGLRSEAKIALELESVMQHCVAEELSIALAEAQERCDWYQQHNAARVRFASAVNHSAAEAMIVMAEESARAMIVTTVDSTRIIMMEESAMLIMEESARLRIELEHSDQLQNLGGLRFASLTTVAITECEEKIRAANQEHEVVKSLLENVLKNYEHLLDEACFDTIESTIVEEDLTWQSLVRFHEGQVALTSVEFDSSLDNGDAARMVAECEGRAQSSTHSLDVEEPMPDDTLDIVTIYGELWDGLVSELQSALDSFVPTSLAERVVKQQLLRFGAAGIRERLLTTSRCAEEETLLALWRQEVASPLRRIVCYDDLLTEPKDREINALVAYAERLADFLGEDIMLV